MLPEKSFGGSDLPTMRTPAIFILGGFSNDKSERAADA